MFGIERHREGNTGPGSGTGREQERSVSQNRLKSLSIWLASRRFPRFLSIGFLTYLVDVSVLWILNRMVGVPLVLATSGAFAAAFVTNFGLNRLVTFGSTQPVTPQLVRFTTLVALNYVATVVFMVGLTRLDLGLVAAKTATTLILAVANFVAYGRWVFRPASVSG